MVRGNQIYMFSGKRFSVFDPQEEDVCLKDITHTLSMVCRFGGHLKEFYSVAQHSVILSGLVKPEHARVALLHDASEAYLGDMVAPLKKGLEGYQAVQARVEQCIAGKYRVEHPMPSEVKMWDRTLCVHEARTFGMSTESWAVDYQNLPPLDIVIQALLWRDARDLFREVLKRHEIED